MVSIWGLVSEYSPWLIAIVAFLLLNEQINYQKKKRFLPGPTFVLPFIGSAISMVKDTTKFWEHQSALAKSSPLGISANYLVGNFVLYIYSTEMSHKIFSNVRPDAIHLVIHPFGKKLLGEHNIIYQFGQQHKDLRRSIAINFTANALSTYSKIQQGIIIKHLKSWLEKAGKNAIPLRILCRDMNLETSQTVFAGPYLSEDARKRFNILYNFFNVGMMKLPFDFPGSDFRRARLAVDGLIETLEICADESEKQILNGKEPICLIDFWMQENVRVKTESTATKTGDGGGTDKPTPIYSNKELGGHLFDFLFAAQDASTSSLLWAITMLESHPNVLERVRSEVAKFWSPESNEPITGEHLKEMKFTEAVAREVVRIRPPATMVPHLAAQDFQLTEDYLIPKGTLIFPSVFDSSFQGFTEPERFDPDRFMEERKEDRVYKRNYLAFGVGAHQCVGQKYAIQHLMLFIAIFVSLIDFKRDRVDGCDDIAYVPTIVPKDDCRVFLSQRVQEVPFTYEI